MEEPLQIFFKYNHLINRRTSPMKSSKVALF